MGTQRPRFALAAVVFALAATISSTAWAQRECFITGPKEAPCSAQLCGPSGPWEYHWQFQGQEIGAGQCLFVTVSGTYQLVIVDRAAGKKFACSHQIFIDKCGQNRPPDCTRAVARDPVLWPPDHTMQEVVIEGVVDPDGDPVAISAFAISQDEPIEANGDGETCADGQLVGGVASVRAERTGDVNNPGNGRVYVISFVAVDARGLRCKGQVTVCVPHDMGLGDTCVDDGQNYDSEGTCPD